jgi:type III secretion protein S
MIVLWLSSPVLAVAAVVGLVVGLLPAVTQIQDQSLPQTIKLISVLVTIVLLGASFSGVLLLEAHIIFNLFPAIGRSVA